MATRTFTFLPEIFRTDTNSKFLNATLDQLTAEPKLKRLNGYVGRTTAPGFVGGTNYLREATADAQNYQLEPTVVFQQNGKKNAINYLDVLAAVQFNGGNISNHDRLFRQEYYTYDGLFDYDKFVNYSQYYWLPNGPETVTVSASDIQTNEDLTIERNVQDDAYYITGYTEQNPVLILARGTTYRFTVDQAGNNFWIQMATGINGTFEFQPNISSRDVFGVTNNGDDAGVITFAVPETSAQDWILSLPAGFTDPSTGRLFDKVDYATDFTYNQIANKTLSYIQNTLHGIDGVLDVESKYFIFAGCSTNDADWVAEDLYDVDGEGYDQNAYAIEGSIVESKRRGVFLMQIDRSFEEPIVRVRHIVNIPDEVKIRVQGGEKYAYRDFYSETNEQCLELLPVVSANSDTLYYQDENSPNKVGVIKIVDFRNTTPIDVDLDIVGKPAYTSVNGIKFTNGLKIRFDSTVKPASYQGNEYYVEGVSDAIRLVKVSDLATPEPFISTTSEAWAADNWAAQPWSFTVGGPQFPEYFTINRGSRDSNSWSRGNRWFHIDVIEYSAQVNAVEATVPQINRAQRPIIEFLYDLNLYNMGRVSKTRVNFIDISETDVFSNIQGSSGLEIDGIPVKNGDRIIFTADLDLNVKNKIYKISIVDASGDGSSIDYVTLAEDGEIAAYECVLVEDGNLRRGKMYWYNGTTWLEAQQKTSINQEPLFNIYDSSGASLSDTSSYPASTFAGTKLFSYKEGTGTIDPYLNIALSYKNLNNFGDIQFTNNFDVDTFTYELDGEVTSLGINIGVVHKNKSLTAYDNRTVWVHALEHSKQYQLCQHTMTEDNTDQVFYLDSMGETNTYINNVLVYVGARNLPHSDYEFYEYNGKDYLRVLTPLKVDEQVNVYAYDVDTLPNCHFVIPSNLENNPNNELATSFTLGQMRQHAQKIFDYNKTTLGIFPGRSNLRDLMLIKDTGGSILQHSASLIPAGLFSSSYTLNFFDSVNYAAKEYQKFKNKLVDRAIKLGNGNIESIPNFVDELLNDINSVKTSEFPWYYSDMIGYGDNNVDHIDELEIEDDARAAYNLSTSFTLSSPSRRAVYIYLNEVQLVYGVDYTFNDLGLGIILSDTVVRSVGDILKIVEYKSTNGSWIPETPSKMGMWPLYVPIVYNDDAFVEPLNMIRGHDGSLTPAYGDFRDDVLMEFEKRVYNNVKAQWNLDKVSLFDVKPGGGRNTRFTLEEYRGILSKYFSSWAGSHGLDFTEVVGFDSNNPFTWNYKRMTSKVDGGFLQGSWKAIFDYYYDTTRPHTAPWEMLGFEAKPTWWDQRYGIPPYTNGNLVLWEDLRDGFIYAGDRIGTDTRFARPYLLDVIPTDENGSLRNPVEIFVKAFDSKKANVPFAAGERGPVEAAWRRSSEYAFVSQVVMALMNPAAYFGQYIDNVKYVFDSTLSEFTFDGRKRRISVSDYLINGETVDGEPYSQYSYTNWIVDRLNSQGLRGVDVLRAAFDSTDVQLSYKMAGYSDPDFLKVLVEQASPSSTTESVVVPDDNLSIFIKKSSAVEQLIYSAVIIERTGTGFKVSGYNLTDPHFTIIPSVANSNKSTIEVLGTQISIFNEYDPTEVLVPYGTVFVSKQQVVDFLVSYQRYLQSRGFVFDEVDADFNSARNFVLSAKEFLLWAAQNWIDTTVISLNPLAGRIRLVSNGLVVDGINSGDIGSSKVIDQNFNYMRNDQLNIVRVGNDFTLKAVKGSMALAILNLVNYDHCLLLDNQTLFNDVIYEPSSGSRQHRIKLIGYKTDDYNGSLSAPGFIYNDPNVDEWDAGTDYKKGTVVKFKGTTWTSVEDIPAADDFDYNKWKILVPQDLKTGLLKNFANIAKSIETAYDLANVNLEQDVDVFAKGLIGFRNRSYFSDLGVEDVSQVNFYRGFIKEKGTLDSVRALVGSSFQTNPSEIKIYENWAIRAGSYGATDINQEIEVICSEIPWAGNPTYGQFLMDDVDETKGIIAFSPNGDGDGKIRLLPAGFDGSVFLTSNDLQALESDIKTAGYLKLTNVDGTIFDLDNLAFADRQAFMSTIGSGFKIWVAKKSNKDWMLFRATQSSVKVIEITNALDGYIQVTTNGRHNLDANDYIAIKAFDNRFDNIYRIVEVNGLDTFIVRVNTAEVSLDGFNNLSGDGILYTFDEIRFQNISEWSNYTPIGGFVDNDVVAIDQWGSRFSDWAVWEKSNIWSKNDDISRASATANESFGRSTTFMDLGQILVTAYGASGQGRVTSYKNKSEDSSLTADFYPVNELETLTATSLSNFGQTLAASDEGWFAVGAPSSNSNMGYVFVFKRTNSVSSTPVNISLVQVIPGAASNEAGAGLAMSKDGLHLFIGRPGATSETGNVAGYKRLTTTAASVVLTGTGAQTVFTLGFTLDSTNSQLLVTDGTGKVYVPTVDYTLSTTQITFGVAPANGLAITAAKQVTWYEAYTSVSVSDDGGTGNRFGSSLRCSTDGAQIIVGAPTQDATSSNNGAAYVLDRTIFSQIAPTVGLTTFTVPTVYVAIATGDKPRVTVDGVAVSVTSFSVGGSTTQVTLPVAPLRGTVVTVETNFLRRLQKLESTTAEVNQFYGYAVEYCPTNCTAFVGAPNRNVSVVDSPDVSDAGAVYRYINAGRAYGSMTGTVTTPTVTIGESIRINDFNVTFTGTSLASVVTDITNAGIPGISAEAVANKLHLIADPVLLANNKIRIGSGIGGTSNDTAAIGDLGLAPFGLAQAINNPTPTHDAKFGTCITMKNTSDVVYIGSSTATTVEPTTFDNDTTSFDLSSIKFKDQIFGSGAVAVYELITEREDNESRPGHYIFAEYLQPGAMQFDDQFGTSIAAYGNYAVVGAPGSDTFGTNFGSLFAFKSNMTRSWNVSGQSSDKVNLQAINRLFIYDQRKHVKLIDLDLLDPVKGKILGVASENIDFVTDQDPAIYGNKAVNNGRLWGKDQIGKVWWNTNTVRFLDYEQGSYDYRISNWGKVFPGSTIDVYEWIQSSVPPSGYVAAGLDGIPAFNDKNVVIEDRHDAVTTSTIRTYFFWVNRKNSIANINIGKTKTVKDIADIITDPKNSGIAYAALIDDHTFGLTNVGSYLVANDGVLNINYDVAVNSQVIHTEFELVQENNPNSLPSSRFISKIIDSLAGLDAYDNVVPDASLAENRRYGIDIRPRQTLFIDRALALRTTVDFLNLTFSKVKYVGNFSIDAISKADVVPTDGFDLEVATNLELSFINATVPATGYKVLVTNDSTEDGNWAIYQLQANDTWLKINTQSFNLTNYWQYVDFVEADFDPTQLPKFTLNTKNDLLKLTVGVDLFKDDVVKILNNGQDRTEILRYETVDGELMPVSKFVERSTVEFLPTIYETNGIGLDVRSLMTAVFNELFVGESTTYTNQLVFTLFRHIMREQKSIDWLFKTSFIDAIDERKLRDVLVFQRDNQDFLLDYINETKPYHTKLREYLLAYQKDEAWEGDVTDFDVPSYYDPNLNVFRTPDGALPTDADLLATAPQYRQWFENNTFEIGSIDIVDGGAGYNSAPILTITGGGGTGAKAHCLVTGGVIVEVVVTDAGTGYTSDPTVVITASGPVTSVARLHAQLTNGTLRKMKTVVKFDRVSYDTAVLEWAASTLYLRGQFVSHEGIAYVVEPADGSSANFTSGLTFDSDNLIELINQDLTTRNRPAEWQPETSYIKNEYIKRTQGLTVTYYRVINHHVSSTSFDTTYLVEVAEPTENDIGVANDRIRAYYNPTNGKPGKEFAQLQSGIEYPGNTVSGENFTRLPVDYPDDNTSIDDVIITGTFIDSDLGTRAEDINLDGAEFVDVFSGYGPEELVPGTVFDTLDLQVYTSPVSNGGPEVSVFAYVGNGLTNTFSYRVPGKLNDVLRVFTSRQGTLEKTKYSIDYEAGTITLNVTPINNEYVQVLVMNNGGEGFLYDTSFTADGLKKQYEIPTKFGSVADTLVYVNGVRQIVGVNYNGTESGTGMYLVDFVVAPANDAYIHVYVYNQSATFREIHTTEVVFSAPEAGPTVHLDRAMRVAKPWHNYVVVIKGNIRLRPPTNTYFVGNNVTTSFTPLYPGDVNGATVNDNDIEVYVNGQQQVGGFSVQTVLGLRAIVFSSAPATDAEIVLSVITNSEFSIVDETSIKIDNSLSVVQGEVVAVMTFSKHDSTSMRTHVHVGAGSATVSTNVGYDHETFDAGIYDAGTAVVITVARYGLEYIHTNTNYVWVYKNGVLQLAGVDYFLRDNGIQIEFANNVSITSTDKIIITEFEEAFQTGLVSYRIFKDFCGRVNYYRIGKNQSTKLTQALGITDTSIHVEDASALVEPSVESNIPGAVMINGERIEYWEKNNGTNTITRLFRACKGTGAPTTHPTGSWAISSGLAQRVPVEYDNANVYHWKQNTTYAAGVYIIYNHLIYQVNIALTTGSTFSSTNMTQRFQFRDKIWYDMSGGVPAGLGLTECTTNQAEFLRTDVGFIPL